MKLAIQGHETRGKEVIRLLEMLGGKNMCYWDGDDKYRFYYIDEYKHIQITCGVLHYILFDLEEFLEKFPYKIGDKVIYEGKIREITKMVWEEQTNTIAYKLDDKLYCNIIDDLQPYKEETNMNKKLAIKGHPTRGGEVIQLLEMLGGKNIHNYVGTSNECYAIDNNKICTINPWVAKIDNCVTFTLEEFEKKFPYKIGDIVKCHAIWKGLIESMEWYEEEVIYHVRSYSDDYLTSVIAKHLQPYKEETNNKPKSYAVGLKDGEVIECGVNIKDNKATGSRIDFSLTERVELDLGDTHEVVVENDKTYVVKKKPTYPKYYTECEASELSSNPVIVALAQGVCMGAFAKLIVLRNAYWEIAGKELGLDKPWEPDFIIGGSRKYSITYENGKINHALHNTSEYKSRILVFPTAEMRDIFYENFKEEIESCKELL